MDHEKENMLSMSHGHDHDHVNINEDKFDHDHDHDHDHSQSTAFSFHDVAHGHSHDYSHGRDNQFDHNHVSNDHDNDDCGCCEDDCGGCDTEQIVDHNHNSHSSGFEHGHSTSYVDHGHSTSYVDHDHSTRYVDHDYSTRYVDHDHSTSFIDHDHSTIHVDHAHASTQINDHDHGHNHAHSSKEASYSPIIDQSHTHNLSITAPSVGLPCNFCDPSSPVLHSIQVTKFRVNNLCCAGEEKLIRGALQDVIGVENVSINIISRFAIIRHCAVHCCAPTEKILQILNDLHLGVSIQDINDHTQPQGVDEWTWDDIYSYGYVALVTVIFIIGLILYLITDTHDNVAPWVFLTSMIIGIFPILKSCWIALVSRHTIDINVLIIVAVAGSVATQDYFDSSLVIALFLCAELLEHTLMHRIQHLIAQNLNQTIPKQAFLTDGKTVNIVDLQIGQRIAVRAGEMIPCDGKIVKGDAVIDESSLTGESIPLQKAKGKLVSSGTVVQNGYIEVEITKSPDESTINQLQNMIQEVQSNAGQYAKLVDFFSFYWTPFIILAAVSVIVIGGCVTKDWWSFTHRGLVILVLACPCSIVISAPIPTSCAMAIAAKRGLVMRNSIVLDKLASIDTIAVDKTGTLTKGFFSITNREFFAHTIFTSDQIMQGIVAIEQKSTHPLAHAIVSDYFGCIAEILVKQAEEGSTLPEVKKLRVIEGVGIEANVKVTHEYMHMIVGNDRVLSNNQYVTLSSPELLAVQAFQAKTIGQIVLYTILDKQLVAMLSLADVIRPEADRFITSAHKQSLEIFMLTGDNNHVAESVCETLNIPLQNCFSKLFPHEKLMKIQELQHQEITHKAYGQQSTAGGASNESSTIVVDIELTNTKVIKTNPTSTTSAEYHAVSTKSTKAKKILMVGDGINDAASLAAATVGCAMGAGGTAMASIAADMILLQDNLLLIPQAIDLSKATLNIILQNITFSVVIKIIGIFLAVFGKYENYVFNVLVFSHV